MKIFLASMLSAICACVPAAYGRVGFAITRGSATVDAIEGGRSYGRRFFVLPADKVGERMRDLAFRECAHLSIRALIRSGFEPAPSMDEADVLVMLNCMQPEWEQSDRAYYYGFGLKAYDAQEVLAPRQGTQEHFESPPLWQLAIVRRDPSGNMRAILPAMFAAAVPYIATTTPGQIAVDIPGDGPDLAYIADPQSHGKLDGPQW
jgi:hypothetical protein